MVVLRQAKRWLGVAGLGAVALSLLLGLGVGLASVAAFAVEPPSVTDPTESVAVFPLAGVNPTPQSIPSGAAFPGYRGGNQLLLYRRPYGSTHTQTNEFGFEVTVSHGVVVAQEGSDSHLPTTPHGFVLSGHGQAKTWLLQHAPLGANVVVEGGQVKATVNAQSLTWQAMALAQHPQGFRLPWQWWAYQCAKARNQGQVRRAMATAHAWAGKQAFAAAHSTLQQALATQQQQGWQQVARLAPANEVRAVWHRPAEQTVEAIAAKLAQFKAMGLNTVYLETLFHGLPLFESATYTRYGISPAQHGLSKALGPNALQVWVQQAHQQGLALHAWSQLFYVGHQTLGSAGPVLQRYPQWANRQQAQASNAVPQPSTVEAGYYFMDPANPEVQAFLQAVLLEAAGQVVDGVQLDYIRYPSSLPLGAAGYLASTWGYTPVALRRFFTEEAAHYGMVNEALEPTHPLWPAWQRFKTRQVSEFVQATSQTLKTAYPRLALSMAIFPEVANAVTLKHQDWPLWLRQGWVPTVVPMTLTANPKAVALYSRQLQRQFPKAQRVVGLFAPFYTPQAQPLVAQIEAVRQARLEGYALFQSQQLGPAITQALQVVNGPVRQP